MSKFVINLNLGGIAARLKSFACSHPIDQLDFERNVCGEEVKHRGGARSAWRCRRCGTLLFKPEGPFEGNGPRWPSSEPRFY